MFIFHLIFSICYFSDNMAIKWPRLRKKKWMSRNLSQMVGSDDKDVFKRPLPKLQTIY